MFFQCAGTCNPVDVSLSFFFNSFFSTFQKKMLKTEKDQKKILFALTALWESVYLLALIILFANLWQKNAGILLRTSRS